MVKITEKLNIIKTAKDDIKTAIENKGITVGDVSISEYAEKINGIEEPIDISDATAKAEDITSGKIAYIAGGKVTGTAPEYWDTTTQNTYASLKNYVKNVGVIDTSLMTNLNSFFIDFPSLEKIPPINTSNVMYMQNMCRDLKKLIEIPLLECGKLEALSTYSFYGCTSLTNLGGFKDLGKAYKQKTANYDAMYTLSIGSSSKLTHESLMNVINNLYDLNISYDVANGGTLYTQKLVIGSTNISKLSAEELAICTAKGWNVS